MGKRLKTTEKEKIILITIFIIHVVILYMLSDYSKAMETYPDEIIYYDMAKSIFEGKNLQLHGVDFQFSKLAYSFVLLPTFLIKDMVMRVRVIMLINALLMSLPFIPCLLICKELEVEKNYSYLAALLVCMWPDAIISGTFMSENLFFPVTCVAYYFILLSYKYKRKSYQIAVVAMYVLTYFTKEIGVCILLADIATQIISALSQYKKAIPKTKDNINILKNKNDKKVAPKIITIIIGLTVCIALISALFNGNSNFYIKSGALDIGYFLDYHTLLYLVYGIAYLTVSTILAFWVIPVIIPVINYKRLNALERKFLLFTILLFAGTIFVIAVTITAREDFGKVIPGVHLRYISSLIVPFISIFFAYLSHDDKLVREKDENTVKDNGEERGIIGSADTSVIMTFLLIAAMIFKGIYNTCTTGTIGLLYIYKLRKIFPNITIPLNGGIRLYPVGAACAAGFAILTLTVFIAGKKSKKHAIYIFTASFLLLSAINLAGGYIIVKDTYQDDAQMIAEMISIDEYFEKNGLNKCNVAFIDESQFSEETKVYDLYFRSADKQFMIPREDIEAALLSAKNAPENNQVWAIEQATFNEPIVHYDYIPQRIDYFITANDNLPLDKKRCLAPITELEGKTYSVYKVVK